jgi:hypothetical protein
MPCIARPSLLFIHYTQALHYEEQEEEEERVAVTRQQQQQEQQLQQQQEQHEVCSMNWMFDQALAGEGAGGPLEKSGEGQVDIIEEIVAQSEIPIKQFVLTHMNRNSDLLERGLDFAHKGGLIDFTTSSSGKISEDDGTKCSRALNYLLNQGVYEGCYELNGACRHFIQKAVAGGRVMLNSNTKSTINAKIQDFDGVSLYPSAMASINGYLKGKPKIIENINFNELNKMDGYFVEIQITKINKERELPLISKLENGVRNYVNECCDMIVDKTTLNDLIEFQKIEFIIKKGYYFNEGYNTGIIEVITRLFNERKIKKAQKNPIQDNEIEDKMKKYMIELMKKNDAPEEQFQRMGLSELK